MEKRMTETEFERAWIEANPALFAKMLQEKLEQGEAQIRQTKRSIFITFKAP
jgi:hypothetical protein